MRTLWRPRMRRMKHRLLALPLLLMALQANAAPAATASTNERSAEPEVQRTVIEDDGARIEELRVRGQVQRITVQSKIGKVRAYEIAPPSAARDPSQRGPAQGQRSWNLLSF